VVCIPILRQVDKPRNSWLHDADFCPHGLPKTH
jgi:hypothetical protein